MGYGQLRIWSAACSTGQEPYSIAMVLLRHFPQLQSWDVKIVATDISEKALNQAKKGVYSDFEIQRGLPSEFRDAFFHKEGTTWRIDDRVKQLVEFSVLNLLSSSYGAEVLDVVFCRNVMIYFDNELKSQVLKKIAQVLHRDGYLILGGSESIINLSTDYVRSGESGKIYMKATLP